MNTLNDNWDLFCSKLKQVKRNNNSIVALCPSHNDKNPSLTASCNSEKILVKCQAGCTFKEITSALEMEVSQFFSPKKKIPQKIIEAVYLLLFISHILIYTLVIFSFLFLSFFRRQLHSVSFWLVLREPNM